MIELRGVSKGYRVPGGRKMVLDGVSAVLDAGRGVGILGRNGAGKSTLLRVLSGMELPDAGSVVRRTTLSWPLGLTGSFQPSMTGRENARFVARIYGEDPDRVVEETEAFAELGRFIDMPVGTYSSGMKSRLGLGVSLAVDFGCYLIDEAIEVGDAAFKRKSREAFQRKAETAKVVIVSHSPATVRAWCDRAAILNGGRLSLYPDLESAFEDYARIMAQ